MLIFYLEGSRITGEKEKGEFISLILFYHFHRLHEHLGISWVITAASSPLHIATDRTRTLRFQAQVMKWQHSEKFLNEKKV